MAGMQGMDVEAVDDLGTKMKLRAEDISQIMNEINALISGSQAIWMGPDADRFRSDWESNLKNQLINVARAVDGAGQSAKNNATEQRDVSQR